MTQKVSTELTYKHLLTTIKQQVKSAQAKAALAVNSSLIQLYWNMDKMIADNQSLFEGRNNYVGQLAKDLKAEFTDMKGFSRANLFFIRKFYQFYTSSDSVLQPVRLKDTDANETPVQQVVALNYNESVQQVVGPDNILASVPWGHHVVLIQDRK